MQVDPGAYSQGNVLAHTHPDTNVHPEEKARFDMTALEAQKAKYHVLAQLQPLAVSLASGDLVSGQVSFGSTHLIYP